jgi:D-arabinose 1-dehydrogenase-like Zn-dependent alcohol dehydrogenase
MCRTGARMVHGYFKNYHPFTFHMTLGHEMSGVVEKIRLSRT